MKIAAPSAELWDLVEAVTAGVADEAQYRRLDELILSDPEAARFYAAYLDQHAALAWGRRQRALPTPVTSQKKSPPPSPMASLRAVGVYAAAALVALAVTAWFVFQPETLTSNHEPSAANSIALLTNTQNAVFAEGDGPMGLGRELSTGTVRLLSGQVQLMFKGGAVVDLSGPCAFDLVNASRGRLMAGRLQAYVPPAASGFRVDTPSGVSVVDLGTEFAIETRPPGLTSVLVYQGHVRLHRDDATDHVLGDMTRGQIARIDSSGSVSFDRLPMELAALDFSGAGADPIDSYPGQQGDGWSESWRLVGLTGDAAVRTNRPLAGGGAYLAVDNIDPKGGGLTRPFHNYGLIDPMRRPYTVSLNLRIDSPEVAQFQVGIRAHDGVNTSSDALAYAKTTDKYWTIFDGDGTGATATVHTQLPVIAGAVYHVEFWIDPESMTYTATIDNLNDNAPAYVSPLLRTRNPNAVPEPYLFIGKQYGGAVQAFSVDAVRVQAPDSDNQ